VSTNNDATPGEGDSSPEEDREWWSDQQWKNHFVEQGYPMYIIKKYIRNLDSPQEEHDRYWAILAAGGNPRYSLTVPSGNVPEETLEKLGVHACKGYRIGGGCDAKTVRCPDRAILWQKFNGRGTPVMPMCKGCKEKHDYRRVSCGNRCSCGNI